MAESESDLNVNFVVSPMITSESKHEESKKASERSVSKETRDKSSKNESVISSLFKGNPEIPKLQTGSGVLLKETVFSGKSFSDLPIHPYLSSNLAGAGQGTLTKVQALSIPSILAGKDAFIKSQTGSGKTLAYAVPLLHKLQEIEPKITRTDGVYGLIVVPTRELALQSYETFQKLCGSFTRIVPGVLLGGEKKKSEKARLRKGINILISTPGRLIDHIRSTEVLALKNVSFFILDEADRMLELGYERDIDIILDALKEKGSDKRQTLMLSATLTSGIEQLSKASLKHPVFIDVAVEGGFISEESHQASVPENLTQTFVVSPAKLRLVTLVSFLLWKCRYSKSRKILIFMATQDMIDYHHRLFNEVLNDEKTPDILFSKLHGNMSQKDRSAVFNLFREGESGVLLCTDVAARGLDLPAVDWIIQFNPPISTSDYVHRVGRTARIGTKGSSLIFVLPSETQFIVQLEEEGLANFAEMTVDRILDKAFANGPLEPSLKTGLIPRSLEEAATNLQMKIEERIVRDKNLHKNGCEAYVSLVRSYASYPKEVRDIFSFKALHLGHIAKSFGLRDAPTNITGIGKSGNWVQKQERRKKNSNFKREERMIKSQRKRINQKALIMSEFSSGLEDESTNKKKKKT